MSYSIKPFIDEYKNKDSLQKVGIRVIYKRFVVKAETDIRVKESQFDKGTIVKHENSTKLNALLRKQIAEIEGRLLDALRTGIDRNVLKDVVKGRKEKVDTIQNFLDSLVIQLKGKISEGRIKHYKSVVGKLIAWKQITFNQISVDLLNSFEAHLRTKKLDGNTVNSNMKLLKSFCNKAAEVGLLDKKQFEAYKIPRYVQKLVDYLTDEEINKFQKLVENVEKPGHKLAGYYFLLSCFAGYRISDLKQFNYKTMVQGNNIILRTTKNKTIVSIPLYSRLKTVLDFIKDHPLYLSEDKVRKYVKELSSLAGIKKEVKVHTARHSFGMMLISKGFSIDEVSELLGDTAIVTKVYARITNKQLSKKVMENLN